MSKATKEQKEKATEAPKKQVRLRQVILETDGNQVRIIKNETAGNLELSKILEAGLAILARG